jgi:putative oxidoreductase
MNAVKKLMSTNGNLWITLPLRVTLGIVFLAHGSQKLFGAFGGPGLKTFSEHLGMNPPMFWATLAACGEFFGGLMVLLGLLTRFGALNIAIVMLVAMFKVHLPNGFFLPKGFEYTFVLLGMALALTISGGGAASVDGAISSKSKGT